MTVTALYGGAEDNLGTSADIILTTAVHSYLLPSFSLMFQVQLSEFRGGGGNLPTLLLMPCQLFQNVLNTILYHFIKCFIRRSYIQQVLLYFFCHQLHMPPPQK